MHAFDRQTDGQRDRQTDGQTEISSLDRVCIACSAVKSDSDKQKGRQFSYFFQNIWDKI